MMPEMQVSEKIVDKTLKQFKTAGMNASFHYAADTCSEWGLGDKHKKAALKLFDENPELQPKMRLIAKGFLWSLTSEHQTARRVSYE